MVDIESDGPIPSDYSMIQIGAVVIDQEGKFTNTFYGELKPISENYLQKALDIVNVTQEHTMTCDDLKFVMEQFLT